MFTRRDLVSGLFTTASLRSLLFLTLLGDGSGGAALAQDDKQDRDRAEVAKLGWTKGPIEGPLSSVASIKVPAGYVYLDAADTRKLMLKMHNPVSNREVGLVGPSSMNWFVVFEYDDCGHVKDDEKGKLDANAILESLKEGTEAGNEERRRNGWETMELIGWQRPPFYNEGTHNLEWATKARSTGEISINHNVRLLGRAGVMEAVLVGGEESYDKEAPLLAKLLEGFKFTSGSTYSEFRPGDKIAEYGLTALITGGAAAVALKTGLFGKLWKFAALIFIKAWKLAVVALVAVGAMFKKILAIFTGRREKHNV